jgi:hypothetical protein
MRLLLLCVCGFVSIHAARADTLELADETTLNGNITFDGAVFTLRARFAGSSDSEEIRIPATRVRLVRFNRVDYNPAAPPLRFRSAPPLRSAPKSSQKQMCKAVLSGPAKNVSGALTRITDTTVEIDGESYPRSRIVSLHVETPQRP